MLVNHRLMQNYNYPVPAASQYEYGYPAPVQNQIFVQPCFVPVTMVHPTPQMMYHPASYGDTMDLIPGQYQMPIPQYSYYYCEVPSTSRPLLHFERNADLYNMKESELVGGIVQMDSGRTYQISKFLNKGTFGKTYKVWSRQDSRYLAMKIVDNSRPRKQEMNRYEVAMSLIIHRNSTSADPLLRLIEHQETDKSLQIVTELLHEDVAVYMKRNEGPKCMSMVQSIAHQLLSAIDKLHSMGLVHTDLKWNNVMFVNQKTNTIKIIDFGGTLTKRRLREIWGCDQLQTSTHRAPEVFLGLPMSEKIDIWSAGIMLIELLTGRRMFQSFSDMSIIWAITQITSVPEEFFDGLHSHKFLIRDPSQATGFVYAKFNEINDSEYWYKHDNFDQIYEYGPNPAEMRAIDYHFQKMISLLLAPRPSARINAAHALKHDFFKDKFNPFASM